MAILIIHQGCWENAEIMEGLNRCFDTMTLLRTKEESIGRVFVYEVISSEVPADHTLIACEMQCIDGIKPFVTQFL